MQFEKLYLELTSEKEKIIRQLSPNNSQLINCPICNRQGVSRNAKACPGCGRDVEGHMGSLKSKLRDLQEKIWYCGIQLGICLFCNGHSLISEKQTIFTGRFEGKGDSGYYPETVYTCRSCNEQFWLGSSEFDLGKSFFILHLYEVKPGKGKVYTAMGPSEYNRLQSKTLPKLPY